MVIERTLDRVRENDLDVTNVCVLSDNGINDISFMEMNTHVTKLSLYNNPISDLSPLRFNTTLVALSFERCTISDLSPLQHNRSIEYLDLSDNLISDISPLRGNHVIKYLYLSGNRIRDLSPLKDTSIDMLYLRNNKIHDVSPLWGLTTLTHISIYGNKHIHERHINRLHGMTLFNQVNLKLRRISLRQLSIIYVKLSS